MPKQRIEVGLLWLTCRAIIAFATSVQLSADSPSNDGMFRLAFNRCSASSVLKRMALTQGGHDPAYLGQAGYVAGVPRLNIPDLRIADWTGGHSQPL
jgi:hypothetical protein